MQLVATLNDKLFRAISVTDDEIEIVKEAMLQDREWLEFQVMSDEELDSWLAS